MYRPGFTADFWGMSLVVLSPMLYPYRHGLTELWYLNAFIFWTSIVCFVWQSSWGSMVNWLDQCFRLTVRKAWAQIVTEPWFFMGSPRLVILSAESTLHGCCDEKKGARERQFDCLLLNYMRIRRNHLDAFTFCTETCLASSEKVQMCLLSLFGNFSANPSI